MTEHQLTYSKIKTESQAREANEVKLESRKRNLLILIWNYLRGEGYHEAANALQQESHVGLVSHEVCENVDLDIILQEYESFYYIKFQKQPKITRRVSVDGQISEPKRKTVNRARSLQQERNPKGAKHDGSGDKNARLPRIPPESKSNLVASKFEARKTYSNGIASSNPNREAHDKKSSPRDANESSLRDYDIALTGSTMIHGEKRTKARFANVVDYQSIIRDATTLKESDFQGQSPGIQATAHPKEGPSNVMLKPLTAFPGYSGEMRDLANSIVKDIYLENPDVKWDDIIGLDTAKRLVKESVVYPIKYPQLFQGILSPWKGLLLYGPPGTGKTLLAKAVATECKTTFFNISASSIVSKWRGDSEKLVRVLFELARYYAPSTIFLDEIDALMSSRGGAGGTNDHEGSRRMKTELLVQMDGLARTDDLVFLLAASNLPWELDHAMLRRLEKRIIVPLPNLEARKSMMKFYLPPAVINEGGLQLRSELDYDYLGKKTQGYSGSDLKLVSKEAAMMTVRSVFDVLENCSPEDGLPNITLDTITTDVLDKALAVTKPSARALEDKYKAWQKEYESA